MIPGGTKAGFSFLLCAAHRNKFALWRENSYIREELKDVINVQNFTAIRAVLDDDMRFKGSVYAYATSIYQSPGRQTKYVESPGVDSVDITVDGTKNASFVTCFASLNPSPDWFVGFSLFDTCKRNETTGRFSYIDRTDNQTLRPWDAGYDIEEGLHNTPILDASEPVHLKTNDRGPYGEWELFDPKVSPSPSPTATPVECFPSNAKVIISKDGSSIRMDQLKVGDHILTRNGEFSQVYMFSHQNLFRKSRFIRLHLSNNRTLAATSGHYVPLHNINNNSNKDRYVSMADINVGDHLSDRFGSPVRVVRIDTTHGTGLFNPHTLQGELVVDDVLVSAFTHACKPNAARAALAFPRSLFRWHLGQNALQRWAAYFFDINIQINK